MDQFHQLLNAPWVEEYFGYPYRFGISVTLVIGTAIFYYILIWFAKWQERSFYPDGHPLSKSGQTTERGRKE